jgi:hypothetical protein
MARVEPEQFGTIRQIDGFRAGSWLWQSFGASVVQRAFRLVGRPALLANEITAENFFRISVLSAAPYGYLSLTLDLLPLFRWWGSGSNRDYIIPKLTRHR